MNREVAGFIAEAMGDIKKIEQDDATVQQAAYGELEAEGTAAPATGEEALTTMRTRIKKRHALVATILRDHELHIRGRMLLEAHEATYQSYKKDIEELHKTVQGCLDGDISDALGTSFIDEVMEIAAKLHDNDVLRRLDITVPKVHGKVNFDST